MKTKHIANLLVVVSVLGMVVSCWLLRDFHFAIIWSKASSGFPFDHWWAWRYAKVLNGIQGACVVLACIAVALLQRQLKKKDQ